MTDMASLQAIIYGRVQGVFFRDFVRGQAAKTGLTGFARNLPDGTVEVQAEGERKQLEELVDHLRAGPPAARVERIITKWSEFAGNYSGFSIRY